MNRSWRLAKAEREIGVDEGETVEAQALALVQRWFHESHELGRDRAVMMEHDSHHAAVCRLKPDLFDRVWRRAVSEVVGAIFVERDGEMDMVRVDRATLPEPMAFIGELLGEAAAWKLVTEHDVRRCEPCAARMKRTRRGRG